MANILDFALGLQTSEFLSKLGFAGLELLSFAGVAELVGKAWDKTWDAIDKGADLQALAAATGESVGMLAQFEHGLDAIGAQFSPMMFLQVQKALSGVNEAGQRTDILFAQLGLDINKLRGQDTVKSITDIAAALDKLNPTQAAGVAEQLFGRFQAQSILQIAREMGGFQEAMGKGALTASQLDKFAKTFQEVKADWADIENDVLGIWVTIAGKIEPEMHKIFTEVDQGVRVISEAFASGQIGQLFGLSLVVGIEYAGSFLLNYFGSDELWESIWSVMKGKWLLEFAVVENAFVQFAVLAKTLMDWVAESFSGKMGHVVGGILEAMAEAFKIINPALSGALGIAATELQQHAGGTTDFTVLAQQNEDAINAKLGKYSPGGMAAAGAADLAQGLQLQEKAIENAMKNASAADKPALMAMIHDLLAKIAGTSGPSGRGSTAGGTISGLENHYKPEFTSLEKMGFVMGGTHAQNPYDQRKVDLLQSINQGIQTLIGDPSAPATMDKITNQI